MRRRATATVLAVVAAAAALPAQAQIALRLDAFQAGPGAEVVVPVRVEPDGGTPPVGELEFVVRFDPAFVVPVVAERTAATADFDIGFDARIPGELRVALTGGTPVDPSPAPELVWLTFRIVGGEGASTALAWLQAEAGGGAIAVSTVDGSIAAIAPQTVASLPDDAHGTTGQVVPVEVLTTGFAGAVGIDLKIHFNPAIVAPVGVAATPLTEGAAIVPNLTVPGQATISIFSATPMTGGGPLVRVDFQAVGALGGRTRLDVRRARFNEGTIATTLDDGAFAICLDVDFDEDGVTDCAGDCDDLDEAVHEGRPESCGDGLDNNCDGFVDNAPIATGAPVVAAVPGPGIALSWSAPPGADRYDVVRGDLESLQATGGDFAAATDACLAEDLVGTAATDPEALAPGEGRWYLVRPFGCGLPGSYGSGGAAQVGARDAEVDAAPAACL